MGLVVVCILDLTRGRLHTPAHMTTLGEHACTLVLGARQSTHSTSCHSVSAKSPHVA